MPTNTPVSSYAVPSEIQLERGGTRSDELSRSRRVQQQVQLRLAEKSSGSVSRAVNGTAHSTASDYGGSSTVKYSTYNPGYSSKSQMYAVNRRIAGSQMSKYGNGAVRGFSTRSAVEMGPRQKISLGAGGGSVYQQGGADVRAGYQTRQTVSRTVSRGGGGDPEVISLSSLRFRSLPAQSAVSHWMREDSDGSLASERDATVNRHSTYSAFEGYSAAGQARQAPLVPSSSMRRSLSGTLYRQAGGGAEGVAMGVAADEGPAHTYKGPAHRTISRVHNRNRMSVSSVSQQQQQVAAGGYGIMGQGMSGSQAAMLAQQGTLNRAMSVKSLHSVGKGVDLYDGQFDFMNSNGGLNNLTMSTAVSYLSMLDPEMQLLGAAYIQHECYHNSDAKTQARQLKAIPALVKLFNSESQDVQRYATGAMRNLIYENLDNKSALIEAGGIPQLIEALRESDDELRKNVTGILWNLSSKDNLKDKLANEALPDLTEQILIPLSGPGETQSPSEADIFYNTTGCLRNLSSVSEKTRQRMRETPGLVDALVRYTQSSLENGKSEDKGVENAVCVLRNLSYQLYNEIPPSVLQRLEGPTRAQARDPRGNAIGCFTPQGKKAKERQYQALPTFTEVSKEPKGQEWLWHPQVVGLYNQVLQRCEINTTTREAASGALQNLTAGEMRWAGVLSRVALEQERMMPVIIDHLRSNNDTELRSLTGFLRNLSLHTRNKDDMATKVVNTLVSKLPSDGRQKQPSSGVVINILATLNNLVMGSSLAARDINFFDGVQKLVAIKTSHDNSPDRVKAAKASSTLLTNMFLHKKLHSEYKKKGFTKQDFLDTY
ncbi:plakophilin-3 isoform X2 [Lepisosteus oculatus]|uniref:plakophilin-3 isoform X2 n=1 Tax=Lepisosteus oculatus TaxID=7918 RepID=UPI0035F50DF4